MGGAEAAGGTNYQQDEPQQGPAAATGSRSRGCMCPTSLLPHPLTPQHTLSQPCPPPRRSPRHRSVQGKGTQVTMTTLKNACVRMCLEGMASWVGGCICCLCSLRLSGVSAFFCGTLHAPSIHFPDNPPQLVEDEILQPHLSVGN